MKIIYGWLVKWPSGRYSIDLFFSSKEKFLELYISDTAEQEVLIPIEVEDFFGDLDYIPDNY